MKKFFPYFHFSNFLIIIIFCFFSLEAKSEQCFLNINKLETPRIGGCSAIINSLGSISFKEKRCENIILKNPNFQDKPILLIKGLLQSMTEWLQLPRLELIKLNYEIKNKEVIGTLSEITKKIKFRDVSIDDLTKPIIFDNQKRVTGNSQTMEFAGSVFVKKSSSSQYDHYNILAIREDKKIFVELTGGFGLLELEGNCDDEIKNKNKNISLKKAKIECIKLGMPINSIEFGDCIVRYLN